MYTGYPLDRSRRRGAERPSDDLRACLAHRRRETCCRGVVSAATSVTSGNVSVDGEAVRAHRGASTPLRWIARRCIYRARDGGRHRRQYALSGHSPEQGHRRGEGNGALRADHSRQRAAASRGGLHQADLKTAHSRAVHRRIGCALHENGPLPLPDTIVGDGTLIGSSRLDGRIPGSFTDDVTVQLRIRIAPEDAPLN